MQAGDRTFGIEIECHLPNGVFFHSGSHLFGIQIPQLPQGWVAKRDGSLQAPNGYQSVEVVSPVLKDEAGIFQVVEVVDFLNSVGAIVNDTCGLHCHVGAADYTQVDVSKLTTLFKRYEKLFFSLNGEKASTRWDNSYCKNSQNWDNPNGDRYQSLNLTNLNSGKKTVEFRLFAGTINVEIIVQAIFMCVGLVNKSKEIGRVKTPRTVPQTWQEMMDKFERVILKGNLLCGSVVEGDALEITREQVLFSTVSL